MVLISCPKCKQSISDNNLNCPQCGLSMQDTRAQEYADMVMVSNRGESFVWRFFMLLYGVGIVVALGLLFTGYWEIAILVLVAIIVVSLL